MKYRYCYIDDLLIDDEKCCDYLEKMALKGWQLSKVGTVFLKFEKIVPTKLKYQIDYNYLSDEYLEMVQAMGYQHIDNYRKMNFFYTSDINALNLQNDDAVKFMVLKENYKTWQIVLLMICVLGWLVIADSMGFYQYLVRYTWGDFLLNANIYFFHYLALTCAVEFFLEGLRQIAIRVLISRQKPLNHFVIKMIYKLESIIACLLIMFSIIIFIPVFINEPGKLVTLILLILVFAVYNYYINKKVVQEANEVTRRTKMIGVALIFFVCFMTITSLKIDFPNNKPLNKVQQATSKEIIHNASILVNSVSMIGSNEKDDKIVFSENLDKCITTKIAQCVFAKRVIALEQEARCFVNENDNAYFSYDKAKEAFQTVFDERVDACYLLEDYFVAIKGNWVLSGKLSNTTLLPQVLAQYF